MRTITVGQFIDAIEKNGLPQHFGDFFFRGDNYSDNPNPKVTQACAVGQAYINLGIYNENGYMINGFRWGDGTDASRDFGSSVESYAINLNDEHHLDFAAIAERLRGYYAGNLDDIMYRVDE